MYSKNRTRNILNSRYLNSLNDYNRLFLFHSRVVAFLLEFAAYFDNPFERIIFDISAFPLKMGSLLWFEI